MSADNPDDTRSHETDFAAMWSSDGATRSLSPTATASGLPTDLPFLFSPGQRFGPYLIVRPLGKGGMGQVYEAEEIESGRRIAMKILSRGLGDDEERERFLNEGQLAASLSHPNTVYVFGTTEVQGFPVIAMELAPGGTLKELVVEGKSLTAAVAVDAIFQVVAGLEAAGALGILHRDIKPSNCFVDRDGRVLVGDFGLSMTTLARDEQTLAVAGTIYIAEHLQEAVEESAAVARTFPVVNKIRGEHELAARAIANHPQRSPEDVKKADAAVAKVIAGQSKGLQGLSTPLAQWTLALILAAFSSAFVGALALIGALVARGGFTYRPFGTALVKEDGSLAGRPRAFVRTLLSWLPAAILCTLVVLGPGPNSPDLTLTLLNTAVLVIFIGCAAWAILHPSRGLQDRFAGTWIVPR